MIASFLLSLAVAGCGGGGSSLPSTNSRIASAATSIGGAASHSTTRHIADVALSAPPVASIAIGSTAAIGSWQAETGFVSGGYRSSITATVNTANVTTPAPQSVYQNSRIGPSLTITIPNLTPTATYVARLHFEEPYWGTAGGRLINGSVNGVAVLFNYDIFAAAGGKNIANIQQVVTNADPSGKITIVLTATADAAIISGVEIVPITISAVDSIAIGSTSAAGGWLAETGYVTGGSRETATAAINTTHVTDPAPQSVYQSDRNGSTLTVVAPNLTPGAVYTARLHFNEPYWTAAGHRLFNATINGVAVLTSFDIFATAGGQDIANIQQFGTTADASGKITVTLTAVKSNAIISGVQIVAGAPVSTPTPIATPTPTPINAAGATVAIGSTTAIGGWQAETGFITGGSRAATTAAVVTSAVMSPAPQAVYQSNRFGPTLTIVVPNLIPSALYTTRLHFNESYWSGAGYRLINASINGVAELTNFDIYAAAGGQNVANIQQFATNADAAGTITVALTASVSTAIISGVEIVPGNPVPTPAPTAEPTPLLQPDGWRKIFPGFAGYSPLPANPVINSQSQAMIDVLYNNTNGTRLTGPGLADAQSTYYTASTTDPLHTIHCAQLWGPAPNHTCNMEGKQIHIPAGAVPGANTDAHTSILAPDGCTLDDFWDMQTDMSQATLTATFGAEYDQCKENGFSQNGGGATQGGGSNRVGRTQLDELETGVIHHAIEVAVSCNPVVFSVGQSSSSGHNVPCVAGAAGPTIPYGAYVWSDVPPANLPANLDKATRMICTALNVYGGVVDDTIGPWAGMSLNGLWDTPGNPSYAAWLEANASNGQTSPTNCFPNGDWSHHIHVLAF